MALASRGQRETEAGVEAVRDEGDREALRAQAQRIHLQALVLATGAALLALAVP